MRGRGGIRTIKERQEEGREAVGIHRGDGGQEKDLPDGGSDARVQRVVAALVTNIHYAVTSVSKAFKGLKGR